MVGNYIRRVRENEEALWKLLLAGAFAGSAAGTAVVLGGLASLTNFCLTNQPLGVGAGMKKEPPLTALSADVMRIQRATVTNADASFNCGRFFRFDWTLWALQFVFLVIFGVIWWKRCLRRFMPGLCAVGAMVTAWHAYKCNYVIEMEPWTQGELHTSGFVVGCGLIACMIGNFCMLFFAGPYSEREHRQRCATMSEGELKKGGGNSASFDSTSNEDSPREASAAPVAADDRV